MRALVLILVASCASEPAALAPQHPANPKAPPGRLAGSSATLRPGVAEYKDLPSPTDAPPPMHHHHGS